MGVDMTPLQVFGCAEVDLMLGSTVYQTKFIVVNPLTNPAILGAGFLKKYKAHIDLVRFWQ